MCVCVGSFFVSMCPQLVPSRPFLHCLGDGFVNDTAGKAISAEEGNYISFGSCMRAQVLSLG